MRLFRVREVPPQEHLLRDATNVNWLEPWLAHVQGNSTHTLILCNLKAPVAHLVRFVRIPAPEAAQRGLRLICLLDDHARVRAAAVHVGHVVAVEQINLDREQVVARRLQRRPKAGRRGLPELT